MKHQKKPYCEIPAEKSVLVARILSLIVPGLGSLYLGGFLRALLWFLPLGILIGFEVLFYFGFAPDQHQNYDWIRNGVTFINLFFYVLYVIICSIFTAQEAEDYNTRIIQLEDLKNRNLFTVAMRTRIIDSHEQEGTEDTIPFDKTVNNTNEIQPRE